jgi:hydrogenase expression/formation protein HypC
MCLSLPVQIVSIDGTQAKGKLGGTEIDISLDLVDDIHINDYVLVHTGFALEKISEEEAMESLRYLQELKDNEPLLD